ncbi:MAG: peptidoglycan-associated lipoprotein Pal [Elusimicrobia bacterium]|nr:peptidoglycan-associated lipoprotein Pal [Elusimicrobiota bacterium]
MTKRHPGPVLLAVFAAFVLASCAPKRIVRKAPPDDAALAGMQGAAGEDDAAKLPSAAEVEEARIRGKEFVPTADLQLIRFDFDAYSVADAERIALRANAEYLKQHPDLEVLIEGHADERGTTEYNLALGQKRAKAVRDYYIRLGVRGGKLATLSFGEERPSCKDATEACWSDNRRAETKVRAQVSSAPVVSPSQVR